MEGEYMELFIGTTEACDEKGSQEIIKQLKYKPNSVLGLATGTTPIGIYKKLVEKYQANEIDFSKAKTFNLDEYAAITQSHQSSYYTFMQENLFKDINIKSNCTFIPDCNAADLEQECESYEEKIVANGGIDLQVLGIGHNGHIGFNEPNTPFESTTQVIQLTESTIEANSRFFDNSDQVPRQALSMGIKTIMQARKIVLIVKGAEKADIINKALNGPITPEIPASVLQLHPNLIVIVDNDAAAEL